VIAVTVVLTAILAGWSWRIRSGKTELSTLMARARERGGPREVVSTLEQYLQRGVAPPLERRARTELANARQEEDDAAYAQALSFDLDKRTEFEKLEAALRKYITEHPDGVHRQLAAARLGEIPAERDRQAYEQAAAAARAAGDDFDAHKTAWQAYLNAYPQGRHAAEARGELAQVPDLQDEARLRKAREEIGALITTDRLPEALDRVDAAWNEVLSPARRAQLEKAASELTARLEEQDAAGCLDKLSESLPAGRQKLTACRLYLLCYPDGKRRSEVRKRLDELMAVVRDMGLARLRAELERMKEQPQEALRLIQVARSDPELRGVDLSADAIRLHLDVLRGRMNESLGGLKMIRLADRTEFVGTATPVMDGWLQLKPRSASLRLRRTLVRGEEVVSAIDPPVLGECIDLAASISKQSKSAELDPARALERVRGLLGSVQGDQYPAERNAIQECVAGLQEFITQTAAASPDTQDQPPQLSRAALEASYREILKHYEATARSEVASEVKAALKQFPDSYEHSFASTSLSVPITWSLGPPNCVSELLQDAPGRFGGRVVLTYPATPRRTSDADLPASILLRIDESLQSSGRQATIEVEYHVRAVPFEVQGVGLRLQVKENGIVVHGVVLGTAAERAGVQAGDRLMWVGDKPLPPNAAVPQAEALIASGSAQGLQFVLTRSNRRFRVTLDKSKYELEKFQAQKVIRIRGRLEGLNETEVASAWADVASPP
jgi:hypothetical protein